MKREDFERELAEIFDGETKNGETSVTVISGELHRRVGGYPVNNHRMPSCCDVMRAAMQEGDEIVGQPPKGKGATLSIRYNLPRR
jgi:5-methylcytosine-specific restriction protein A